MSRVPREYHRLWGEMREIANELGDIRAPFGQEAKRDALLARLRQAAEDAFALGRRHDGWMCINQHVWRDPKPDGCPACGEGEMP